MNNTDTALYDKQAVGVGVRYLIRGLLELESPTSLSNGDDEGQSDIPIRRDIVSNRPLLPGTSLAGALRDYLIQRLPDVNPNGLDKQDVEMAFGFNEEDSSQQSRLFIEDALATEAVETTIRDNVALDPKTRTAQDGAKFDMELLPSGTLFPLHFVFWEPAAAKEKPKLLRQLVTLALEGLTAGEIQLGGRKRRGLGRCGAHSWQVHRYDMQHKKDILRWLTQDESQPEGGESLSTMMALDHLPDLSPKSRCLLEATFAVGTSLLIRAAANSAKGPDHVHLMSNGWPIISGSSLAGALRARAERIVDCLGYQNTELVEKLFGPRMKDNNDKPQASRIWVDEAYVQGGIGNRVQSRVKLDRFTAGSYPGALFSQQPHFGGEVTLRLRIDDPKEPEVGLLLLLLKDLWTGDLPLGGEASVGRGRLQGLTAKVEWQGYHLQLDADADGRLAVEGDLERAETAVVALTKGGQTDG